MSEWTGFSVLPGGYRDYGGGALEYIGNYGSWWSSSLINASDVWNRGLSYGFGNVLRYDYGKPTGFSVRCVKD